MSGVTDFIIYNDTIVTLEQATVHHVHHVEEFRQNSSESHLQFIRLVFMANSTIFHFDFLDPSIIAGRIWTELGEKPTSICRLPTDLSTDR